MDIQIKIMDKQVQVVSDKLVSSGIYNHLEGVSQGLRFIILNKPNNVLWYWSSKQEELLLKTS